MDVKDRLKALAKLADGKKEAFILIYGNPDPDALASGWALRECLRLYGVVATLGYTGEVGRLENEAMIKELGIPVVKLKEADIANADLLALTDSQPIFFRNYRLPRCDIVIDHHPSTEIVSAPHVDIRPKCHATSSIMAEYLLASGVELTKKMATALFYGIETDSRHLIRPASEVDKSAIVALETRLDRTLLRRIEYSNYSLSRLDYFSIALVKLSYANHVLYSNIGPVPSADVCVQIADFLVRVKEAHWALVSGVVAKQLVIVFRCDGQQKDAGKTARKAFGEIGSAGGHHTMGRAEIDESALPKDVMLTQNESLERFILTSLAEVEHAFKPLARALPRRSEYFFSRA